jgi:exodeoxyribonuclease V beta subunit
MLLDEFQDTSILQYEILKPLISEITSGEGIFNDGSFFFVGDVKQSIYRFRGGVSALFGEVVKQNNTEVEKLRTNYRSQKEVVEFVNNVFKDKIQNYTSQFVREGVTGGYVSVIENDEILQEVLTQVKRLLLLGADKNNIAILSATNRDGEEIKDLLEEEGIEVVTEITTKLINQKSVMALLEYLKYLYFKEEIYRENFFALISQKPQKIEFVDLTQVGVVDVVKRAIEKYTLSQDDFHLLRFLNVLSNYSDIESLLFEYERIDITAALSDVSGVRVLTVHKSKGLEYEHVIIMDRLKEPPTTKSKIIYEYEGITLESLYLRVKGREFVDSRYERALAKEQQLEREDSLNAMYVAFTRAREHLIIIQKSEKSSFAFLNLQVENFGLLEVQQQKKEEKQHFEVLKFEEYYYGSQSDLLEMEQERESNLEAINFGIALHYMLEMMADFTQESIPSAKNMMINRFGLTLTSDAIEDIVHRVLLFVESKEVEKLLEGVHYKEKALRYKNTLRYVDLLIEKADGSFVVIDYKSSFALHEQHHKQVDYYVKAIESISKKNVRGFICYLLADEVKLISL